METLIIPLVLGLTEVFKLAGVPTKYVPALAILLGIAGVVAVSGVDATNILQGIVYGLSASGLWSGVKTVLK